MLTGATIRKYRELRGLSQLELARRIGISRQAVCNGESGAVQRPRWYPQAAEILDIPDETWMSDDEVLVKLSELADLLLCRRSEERSQRPPSYGAFGVGRPAAHSA